MNRVSRVLGQKPGSLLWVLFPGDPQRTEDAAERTRDTDPLTSSLESSPACSDGQCPELRFFCVPSSRVERESAARGHVSLLLDVKHDLKHRGAAVLHDGQEQHLSFGQFRAVTE